MAYRFSEYEFTLKSRPPEDEVISQPNWIWSIRTRGMWFWLTSHWEWAVMSTHMLVLWDSARKL
jgi:hypothetical protein